MPKSPPLDPAIAKIRLERSVRMRALKDTIHYLEGIHDVLLSEFRADLEATGHKSSTTLLPGGKVEIKHSEDYLCDCHELLLYACPAINAGEPVVVKLGPTGQTYTYVKHPEAAPTTIPIYDLRGTIDGTAYPVISDTERWHLSTIAREHAAGNHCRCDPATCSLSTRDATPMGTEGQTEAA